MTTDNNTLRGKDQNGLDLLIGQYQIKSFTPTRARNARDESEEPLL
jgi:hypothetical protein